MPENELENFRFILRATQKSPPFKQFNANPQKLSAIQTVSLCSVLFRQSFYSFPSSMHIVQILHILGRAHFAHFQFRKNPNETVLLLTLLTFFHPLFYHRAKE
jgi:uncharacterized membrane protein